MTMRESQSKFPSLQTQNSLIPVEIKSSTLSSSLFSSSCVKGVSRCPKKAQIPLKRIYLSAQTKNATKMAGVVNYESYEK